MNLYEQFATSKDLEINGVSLNYGKNNKDENIEIFIARAGGANIKFKRASELIFKTHKRQISNDTLTNDELETIIMPVYVKNVILGWKGVEDRDGKSIPFSVENAIKLFTDLPDLYADVRQMADNQTLFRQELRQEDSKNL